MIIDNPRKKLYNSLVTSNDLDVKKHFSQWSEDEFDKKLSEDRFIELVYKFSYNRIHGNVPNFLNPGIWDLFTYKLDPLINLENEVTFVTQL